MGDFSEFAIAPVDSKSNDFEEFALAEPDQGGIGDATTDFLRQFGEGFNQGIAGAMAAPSQITNLASQGINAVTDAVGLGEPLGMIPDPRQATAVGRFLSEDTDPRGFSGRAGQSIGEFVGGDLPLAATAIAAAPAASGIKIAQNTGLIKRGVQAAGQAISNTPGRAAFGELAASTGAGIGGQVAEEIAPGSKGARMTGELIGAFSPAATAFLPSALAFKAINASKKRFSSKARAERARKTVSDALKDELTPQRLVEMQKNLDLQDTIPGTNFTLAELIDTPSLKRSQEVIGTGFRGERLDQEIARRENNIAAIDAERKASEPKGSTDPDIIVEDVATRISRARETATRGLKAIDLRERNIADNLPSGINARTQGKALRDELIDRRSETKSEMRRLAEDSGLNDPTVEVDFSKMRSHLSKAIPKVSDFTDKAALPDVLSSIKKADDTQPFPALMELRSRITDDISDALRGIPKRKLVANLEAIKSKLDESIDAAVENTNDPELAQRYRNFRDVYRRELIEPFETGASFRVLQKDGTRAYKVRDEVVAREFFADGDEQAALSFKKVFGDSPQANDTMAAATFDSLSDFAVRDGIINPSLLKTWIRKHKSILDEFPNIKSQVNFIENATLAIGERKALFRERAREIENNVLTKEIKKIDAGTKEPATFIKDAITQPGRMSRILSAVRSKSARDAIARISFDSVLDSPNPQAFMDKNKDSLIPALGKAGFNNLKRIIKATSISNRVRSPAGDATDLGVGALHDVESALGTGLNQLSSRIFAVKSGRTSSRFVTIDVLGRALRKFSKDQSRKVLEEALFNPELGRELALYTSIKSNAQKTLVAKRLYTFLIGIGLGPDQPEDQ